MNAMADVSNDEKDLAARKAQAERFLRLLDETADGFCFQTFDDLKSRKDGALAHTRHGALDDLWPWLERMNQRGAGVFVTVNAVQPGAARTAANVIRVRALFADFDPPETAAAPDRYPIHPAWQVESSPGKRHVYWPVEGLATDGFKAMQERVIHALRSDHAPKDLPRVMRLPGFFHMKDPSAPSLVRLVDVDERMPYSVEALSRAFPPIQKPEPRQTGPVETAPIDDRDQTVMDLRSALASMRSDDRDLWVRMGLALKGMGDQGRALWMEWSQTSDKFDARSAAKTWESFKPESVDYRAVFTEAQSGGWVNPAKGRRRASGGKVVKMKTKPQARAHPHQAEPSGVMADWRSALIIKHKDDGSQIIPCRVHNLIHILKHSPEFEGRIRFNEFSGQVAIDGQDLDDIGPVKIKAQLECNWIKEKVATTDVVEAMSVVAQQSSFHPVREWLQSLSWDGVPRVESFCHDYLGKPLDAYHIAVARALFVSAVLRILKPGCKVDTMTILEGLQGQGKSTLWLALFDPWYAEITDSLNSKDFFIGLSGVWCADFGELDQFSKAETTRIKQVITSQSDHYRGLWKGYHKRHPRQCIFVGGTNTDNWQTDATGARRFLPIKLHSHRIDVDAVRKVRDQLWAEAVFIVQADPGRWWDIPDAAEHQEASYVGDTWEEIVGRWLSDYYIDWKNEPPHQRSELRVTVAAVLEHAIRLDPGKHTRPDQTRAGNVLRRLGWVPRQSRIKGTRVRFYEPNQEWLEAQASQP